MARANNLPHPFLVWVPYAIDQDRQRLAHAVSPGGTLFIRTTPCMFPWMGENLAIRNNGKRSAMSAVVAGLAILLCGCASIGRSHPVTDDFPSSEAELWQVDFDKWRDLISPTSDELAFERIAWSASLGEGFERAGVEQKPLLLWMMNGHPLGRT